VSIFCIPVLFSTSAVGATSTVAVLSDSGMIWALPSDHDLEAKAAHGSPRKYAKEPGLWSNATKVPAVSRNLSQK